MVIYNGVTGIDNAIDFLRIYEKDKVYYGGDQSWFTNETLRRVGCSIVAAANITAYTAVKQNKKRLYMYDDISKNNFQKHMEYMARFIHPDEKVGVISTSYFINQAKKYILSCGYLCISKEITTKDYFENIKVFLKEALEMDKPVAMLMLKNDKLKEFDNHWMTVTRVFENEDSTYVDFSSWGERRIFKLEDFYKFSTFGALIYFNVV